MFTIDNNPVAFQLAEFDKHCVKLGVTWKRSSLRDLRALLAGPPAPTAQAVLAEIRKIKLDKRQKYSDAIKYLVFSIQGMIDGGQLAPIADGRMLDRKNFKDMFATMRTDTDYVDLQYGISSARGMLPYQLDVGRVRFADDFNNSSNLGTGMAFERSWNGQGFLTAKPKTVAASFKRGETPDDQGRVQGILSTTRDEYVNSMLNSRYSPTRAFNDKEGKLLKDTHKSRPQMVAMHGEKNADKQLWMHARFVKSVRRACKGGIAMVASHPAYKAVDAKVHFVLDGLGDLGKLARKDALAPDRDYVAITSSELDFCCRYWDDAEYPLKNVVKFYVNGFRVYPPWEKEYTLNDANGNPVYSNHEGWLRYRLYRDLAGKTGKAFPKSQ